MLYFKCISFTDNGNDIKADRGINTEMFDVSISGYYNMASWISWFYSRNVDGISWRKQYE